MGWKENLSLLKAQYQHQDHGYRKRIQLLWYCSLPPFFERSSLVTLVPSTIFRTPSRTFGSDDSGILSTSIILLKRIRRLDLRKDLGRVTEGTSFTAQFTFI